MSKFTSFQSLKSYLIITKVVNKSYDSAFNKLIMLDLSLAPEAFIFFIYYSGNPYSKSLAQLSSHEGSSNL